MDRGSVVEQRVVGAAEQSRLEKNKGKNSDIIAHTDAIEMHPAGAYPTILHCLGFICSIYILILDEGYVLT